jgi:opacity protein-like surface antigen
MKKCLCVLMFCWFIIIPALANAGEKPADNIIMFKLGYMKPSITIENPIGDNVDLDPGAYYELSYTRKFGKFGVRGVFGYAYNTCDKSIEYENGFQESYKSWLTSVNMPVTFVYIYSSGRFDFYAGAGPGFYYRKIKLDYSNRSYQESTKSSSFNIGAQGLAGIDFRIIKNLAVGADLEYNFFRVKFNNDYSDNGNAGEYNPSLSVSYSF